MSPTTMAASPTPIPEPRNRGSDPLDIPNLSAHASAAGARSPLASWTAGSLGPGRSPPKYFTPHSASIASQWQHARQNSFSKTTAQGRASQPQTPEVETNAASAPTHRSGPWPTFSRYEIPKPREPSSSNTTGTPFTSLYRQLSNSRRTPPSQTASADAAGFSSSFGSSLSESPSTPQPMPEPEYSSSRRYAERLEHVDADGMWSQPVSLKPSHTPIAEPKEEVPSFRRSLQRHLSIDGKRKPSPMSERLLMGHLDTQ